MAESGEQKWWSISSDEVLEKLTSKKSGLSSEEAKKRLAANGSNSLASKNKISAVSIFLEQFKNWLTAVLVIAALVSLFLHEPVDTIVIIAFIVLSAVFGFIQEYKAEQTLQKLKRFIRNKASVYRDSRLAQIDTKKIVQGDVIKLRIGDIVPADIRLMSCDELAANEAVLTGESQPVEKKSDVLVKNDALISEATNMLFMGTSVAQGNAIGVVVLTGKDTEFGKIAQSLKEPATQTDFQLQIANFSKFLFKVIVLMTIFIFVSNVVLNKGVFLSFLFAVALAVGIAPEMLPAILTVTLSQGALRMAKKKVVVKKLASVEDFGNIDTLCMDKTGTITEGKFSLFDYVGNDGKRNEKLMLYSMLCTSGMMNKEKGKFNATDKAIWESIFAQNFKKTIKNCQILDENEFDYDRQRMSVSVAVGREKLLIAKGSAESIIKASKYEIIGGKKFKLTSLKKKKFINTVEAYEMRGFRVIAVAYKEFSKRSSSPSDENNLSILGLLLFRDPLKATTAAAIKKFIELGISLKVISGDGWIVTKSISKEAGIEFSEDQIVTGEKLRHVNDEGFVKLAKTGVIFARLSPDQKYRIIKALNYDGHIVGYMGDGVNDVPALREADVGITVEGGSDIAKEASDIILLEKDLKVLVEGIEAGRKTFGNIMKYILNTISANYGNMFTVAVSSVFLQFIPLLPSQILLNNFISDVPMFALATDNVDEGFMKKPNKWNLNYIKNFMVSYGLVGSIFDMCLILPMLLIFKVDKEVFWTAWFIESSISEMIVTFVIRTKLPFYKSRPSNLLIIMTAASILVVLAIAMLPFGQQYFTFTNLSTNIWLLIIFDLVGYFVVTEIVKKSFFRKLEMK